MAGRIRTRRFNDPALPDDGTRILVTRFRPRGVRREDETWSEWWKELGPSVELHAAAYGKGQPAIDRTEYRARYLAEMSVDPARYILRGLVGRVAAGEDVTLLCSSACVDETRCHRTLLVELVRSQTG
jgi:uncharacterized protein YeaO (DUF488 family)